MPTLRKLFRLPSRFTKKAGSGKGVRSSASKAYAKTPAKQSPKAKYAAKYAAFSNSEFEGGIVPYIPAATKALTTRTKHVVAPAKKQSMLAKLFARKKAPMTGGVAYRFNLDCKDGGLMRPEAISECPPRGPADPLFFTELY
jgi:hypothetical protein